MNFDTLEYDQQINQLAAAARQALSAWNLGGAALELRAYTNNAVFQVYGESTRYILRVHRPGHKRREWIESERVWLNALSNNTQLRVPVPLKHVFEGEMAGVDQPVLCDLLGWLDGEALPLDALTKAQIVAVGVFAAHLHNTRFDPPPGFERPHLDWEGLFGQRSPYHSDEGERYFSESQRQVIARVTDQVQAAMNDLGQGRDEFGLIHADLLPKNVLFSDHKGEQRLAVVDFNDCAWGYYLYDLAPMLWVSRASEYYEAIREALWQGYTSVRPLNARHRQHLETFVAARHVASCRWIAGYAEHPDIRGRAASIISERVDEMRVYLATGSLSAMKEVRS